MAWFAVVEKATGKLLSTGTVVDGNLPATLEVLPIAEQPGEASEWDEATKSLKPRPQRPHRLDEFLADAVVASIMQSLTPAQRQALRTKLDDYVR